MPTIINDGFKPELVEGAVFDGVVEIPSLARPKEIYIPSNLTPFSVRNRADAEDIICFYEKDDNFSEIIDDTNAFLGDLEKYKGIVTPDCSLYIDMPLCLQIANIYFNRAVGYRIQSQGMYVIPNVRWGDERTYTNKCFSEKIAFLGLPKKSIVSVGTYGQIQKKIDKKYFREGLEAMLEELEPEVVLVYGSLSKKIFEGLLHKTEFVQYNDWTSRVKGGSKNGNN
ncbi:MAG: DUF4417 domain-containing protein [Lachnospiraceae bacterium]|nr:DUF4417 domain-containing protein [Lachnospiraceae bacterium]